MTVVSAQTVSAAPAAERPPTLWGLGPVQLHDHYWACRGIQVVRQGQRSNLVAGTELYMLTDAQTLVLFRTRSLIDVLSWLKPDVCIVRLSSDQERGYQESALTDEQGHFQRFQRSYGGSESHTGRVALTRSPRIAREWEKAPDANAAWRLLRKQIGRDRRETRQVAGRVYDQRFDPDLAGFVRDLMVFWPAPDATIARARRVGAGGWTDRDAHIGARCRLVGPVWIGAGRTVPDGTRIVGPAILWDDPSHRPPDTEIPWEEIEPTELARSSHPKQLSSLTRAVKRLFDIVFALLVLAITLPFYPLVMLGILLEDGRPVFFRHKRETIGGREFYCIKFRSMRKDADEIKKQILEKNQADGPQFFMENDPRLTRVGRILRKANIDELPQFINVLQGDMAVVGPRPSPRAENQFCPPWREARLSVRPGITGLWQVKRTRMFGRDFQEWIKYDIEYVENLSLWLDATIIIRTFFVLLRGVFRT